MRTKADRNKYQKKRRAALRAQGICVDCQQSPAVKPHVLCNHCRYARGYRIRSSKQLPLPLETAL